MSEILKFVVYELPEKLTDGFCFNGGKSITFKNVDWFDGPPPEMMSMMGNLKLTRNDVIRQIKEKRYYNPSKKYLVLCNDDNYTFTIGKEIK